MKVEKSDSEGKVKVEGELVASRIAEIESTLMKESWLPFSLRGMLAAELPQVLKTVLTGGKFWQKRLSKQLLVLSLATWVYGPSALESKTVASVQALDLEINGSLHVSDAGVPVKRSKKL